MRNPSGLYAVGMVQLHDSSIWQVWISTTGDSVRCVAACKDHQKAHDIVILIQLEAQKGSLQDPNTVAALFGFLNRQSDCQVVTLPSDIEQAIMQDLALSRETTL